MVNNRFTLGQSEEQSISGDGWAKEFQGFFQCAVMACLAVTAPAFPSVAARARLWSGI